eukprot:1113804-Amphidinium_carterae.1
MTTKEKEDGAKEKVKECNATFVANMDRHQTMPNDGTLQFRHTIPSSASTTTLATPGPRIEPYYETRYISVIGQTTQLNSINTTLVLDDNYTLSQRVRQCHNGQTEQYCSMSNKFSRAVCLATAKWSEWAIARTRMAYQWTKQEFRFEPDPVWQHLPDTLSDAECHTGQRRARTSQLDHATSSAFHFQELHATP